MSNKIRDTLRSMIRSAKPSAIADLPTPGSPINIGLFFFLLLKIWDTRSISFCLPTTGSSFPFSAKSVKSLPKLSKTGVFDFFIVLPFFPCSKGFGFSELNSSSEGVSAIGLLGRSSASSACNCLYKSFASP